MLRNPADRTFGATAWGAVLVTVGAFVAIGYAVLTLIDLLSPSLLAGEVVRLAF
jgi:hypothetical protein